MAKNKNQILALSKKSCPVGPELHPPFDASSPLGCCPQSREILLNKEGYDILRLSIKCTRLESICSYSTHSSSSDWLKGSGNESTGQTQFSTKFAAKLSFMPQKKRFW
jgi:hypothetical protein